MPQLKFQPLSNPILLISDNPCYHTGLARIGRDLAALLCTMPEFRVGYLGRGIGSNRKFPWAQYDFPEYEQWGEHRIESVWNDFSGGRDGIIMSLWDASRMLWFGNPVSLGNTALERFLGRGRNYAKWGYFPIDSVGPDGEHLPIGMQASLAGYDRVIAASEFGSRTIGENIDWQPHGINVVPRTFKPNGFQPVLPIVVSCNMTNQARKDWPIAFATAARLKEHYGNRFQFHTQCDQALNYWNLYALAAEYDVESCWVSSFAEQTDERLGLMYSMSHCTLLPSGGEGFGYPIAESLACGTPCVTGNYAAGAELVTPSMRVDPVAYRVDTQHNVTRAVYNSLSFAQAAVMQIEAKENDWDGTVEECTKLVEHLQWSRLRASWEKWFRAGLKQ